MIRQRVDSEVIGERRALLDGVRVEIKQAILLDTNKIKGRTRLASHDANALRKLETSKKRLDIVRIDAVEAEAQGNENKDGLPRHLLALQ